METRTKEMVMDMSNGAPSGPYLGSLDADELSATSLVQVMRTLEKKNTVY